jgi:phenylpropionate dioxygenase-like ring-hydroxylating dioxygenase large terminal subunit
MFAKLFTTKHGQLSLLKIDDKGEEYNHGLVATYNIQPFVQGSEAVVTKHIWFGETDEGEEMRDKTFSHFDQDAADKMSEESF